MRRADSLVARESATARRGECMGAWDGKVVLVTGASAGLGLSIAEAFALAGAQVALVARRAEPLAVAAQRLSAPGRVVLPIVADVTRQADVERMVAECLGRFGRMDVLVNNAGRSARGRLLDTPAEEFVELVDLNLVAVVRCTRAAMAALLAARGHVVNIGSLAAKSAGRWLGAYPASKFALAGYTQQLRLEMEPEGLHVLLVCPGPIARDEPRVGEARLSAEVPESARRPGGGVKTRAILPEELAAEIVQACARRQVELIRPRKARLLFVLSHVSPRLGDWLVRRNT